MTTWLGTAWGTVLTHTSEKTVVLPSSMYATVRIHRHNYSCNTGELPSRHRINLITHPSTRNTAHQQSLSSFDRHINSPVYEFTKKKQHIYNLCEIKSIIIIIIIYVSLYLYYIIKYVLVEQSNFMNKKKMI